MNPGRSLKKLIRPIFNRFRFARNQGYCPICEEKATFIKQGAWLRDEYRCNRCKSIPRNRALVQTLNKFYPGWRDMTGHKSSPSGVLSSFLKNSARNYSSSHYFDDVARGEYKNGFRSEDLSSLTFASGTFDLFITSDVFEHIMEPEKTFAEIARVLKPGGTHVFTMSWYPELEKTRQRVKMVNNAPVLLEEAVYHGNPIVNEGSIVTFDWGRDFTDFIFEKSELKTTIYLEKNNYYGLETKFLEVFISVKN